MPDDDAQQARKATPRRALGLVLLPVAEWVDDRLFQHRTPRRLGCKVCATLGEWVVGW